jgi:hypothetical protein
MVMSYKIFFYSLSSYLDNYLFMLYLMVVMVYLYTLYMDEESTLFASNKTAQGIIHLGPPPN